jgi:hypothetical protein
MSYPEGHWLAHTCVMGACLAHRRDTYWNPQERRWVHPDGWPCEALASLPEPYSRAPWLPTGLARLRAWMTDHEACIAGHRCPPCEELFRVTGGTYPSGVADVAGPPS